ncbi:magnesium transporter [Corallincola luteus]|uniref:Magnesium transporter MgtE n=2 Tax=Corallincola TaxID=1775176 RepID=A0A368NI59_9GAMM|nr:MULTISPECIES: magnesium transporter [Corallincola]RCU49846.1 magnesium transporter [Corallincola holothuriorum]TCI03546.1 magnesium transporter [Corallincola luteus]
MAETLEQDLTQQKLKEVKSALDSGMFIHVRRILQEMDPSDVALLFESTPTKGRAVLWQLVDPDLHGEILEELSEDVKDSIIRLMDPELVAAATEGMDTDDLANLLRGLPDSVYREILAQMDAQDRHRVEAALSYPEETAGAIMNTDTVTLRPDVTVDVILRYLRLKGELPEATDNLYVVNLRDELLGQVSLTTLVTANPSATIADVMDTGAEKIPADMEETEVAQMFERYNWISAPVVDDRGVLLGRITIDDVVDIIREDAEHSMMSMAGLDDEEDTFAPVLKSTKRRTVWLGINLLTALMAAFVSNLFEDTLAQMATLAVLMTIVPSMGGIAGSQTLTLVIRGMALGHIGDSNSRWLLGKEALIGLLNGLIWALLIAAVVAVWKQDIRVGAVIAFAMLVNMVCAGASGVMIPLLMKRMNIDPALAGGVVLTTITDVVGLFAFLGVATWLLL